MKNRTKTAIGFAALGLTILVSGAHAEQTDPQKLYETWLTETSTGERVTVYVVGQAGGPSGSSIPTEIPECATIKAEGYKYDHWNHVYRYAYTVDGWKLVAPAPGIQVSFDTMPGIVVEGNDWTACKVRSVRVTME